MVSKLRRFARDQASRSLYDQLWVKHLLHQKVSGPLVEIMKLLVREAGSLFAQSPKELKLNARKDEIDVDSWSWGASNPSARSRGEAALVRAG